jgi:hypothetical protein
MKELHINSNLILRASYNSELEELNITFRKNGATWKYYGVTQYEINKMLLAPSQGSYFLTEIKATKKAIQI